MATDELRVEIASTAATDTGSRGAPVRERALLARTASGDRSAFEQLYRAYYPRLFAYLFRLLRQAETVEETLNDVMLAVWRQADGFRGDSRVSTWIFGIAYRQALKTMRRGRSQPTLVSPDVATEPTDERNDSDRREREIQIELADALERLSPEHRAVVELTYHYGYSYREISRIVGCPTNTVKTRMFHARRKLQQLMPSWGADAATSEEAR